MTTDSEWATILDSHTIFDDGDVLALNKPAGISVMGERHGTDLVVLANQAGEQLYPVHRIDKATSGLVMFTRRLETHGGLTRQFNKRTADKTYLAVTRHRGLPDSGHIDLPLSVGRKNRVRVAGQRDAITRDGNHWSLPSDATRPGPSYPSTTRFVKLWQDKHRTLLALRPVTGRRHQLRVHLAWIGHAIDGDALFAAETSHRTLLHSWQLTLDKTWINNERDTFTAPPDDTFWELTGVKDVTAMLTHAQTILHKLG